jgi:hypothetical protein
MRERKTHSMFLPALFGVMGLIILTLAWLQPIGGAERVAAMVMGSAGISGALLRIPALKRLPGRSNHKRFPAKIEFEKQR